MDIISLLMIVVPILLLIGMIYNMIRHSSSRAVQPSESSSTTFHDFTEEAVTEKALTSNEDTLFAGQLDDPIEALTSSIRLKDVDRLIKSDFPVEKHAEVVDVLSKCTTAHKATVYSITLGFAKGDIDKLREYVKIANRVGDYRDLAQALLSLSSR